MKHSRVTWLVGSGALLFAIGLFVPLNYTLVRAILLIAGAALVFLFYFYTLIRIIRSRSVRISRKIVWVILVICLPVLGNLLYMVIQDSINDKQRSRYRTSRI